MNATKNTFQAELDAVCAAIKVKMPNAAEGEDLFEGEGEAEGEGENWTPVVRTTACALSPNPVDPGKSVAVSGLTGHYRGTGAAETVKITAGFRNGSGGLDRRRT